MSPKEIEKATRDDLIKALLCQNQIIKEQNQKIEELEKKIKELQKDSSNSSKPPSSDMQRPNHKNQSLRKKSGKKPGGQKGHKGYSRLQTENPEKIVRCEPAKCECCGKSLEKQRGEIIEKRQERDIPPIEVHVTEYQKVEKKCLCGHKNQGVFPEGITAPVQIGSNAKAFMTYLNTKQLIPFDRLREVAIDLFNFRISTGSIDNILEIAYEKGMKYQKEIMREIKKSEWVGSDETGIRFEGKRGWLWTWQNKNASYYTAEKGRGYEIVKEHFGEDYDGRLIHDCWSAQNNTKAKKGHQQCHPHLQRELEFLIKEYRSKWAYEMDSLLSTSQKAREKIWQEGFDELMRKRIIEKYNQILEKMNQQILKTKAEKTLQKRFRKHKDEIFFFMKDPETPFHNNGSEQAIRVAKVKQKVSGGFRSKNGADRYACLLSFIETCRKQGKNTLQSIRELLQDNFSFNFTS